MLSFWLSLAVSSDCQTYVGRSTRLTSSEECVNVFQSVFIGLQAPTEGGAIYLGGWKMTFTLSSSNFIECRTGTLAGGILTYISSSFISDSCFIGCTGGTHGQAFHTNCNTNNQVNTTSTVVSMARHLPDSADSFELYDGVAVSRFINTSFNSVSTWACGFIYQATKSIDSSYYNVCNNTGRERAVYLTLCNNQISLRHMNIVSNTVLSKKGLIYSNSNAHVYIENFYVSTTHEGPVFESVSNRFDVARSYLEYTSTLSTGTLVLTDMLNSGVCPIEFKPALIIVSNTACAAPFEAMPTCSLRFSVDMHPNKYELRLLMMFTML